MPSNRLSNRVAWDHTVLVNRSAKLDWKPAARPIERPKQSGQPLGTMAAAWGLIAWSGLTAWSLWTRNDLDSHISMRLLMRGDFEEVAGVVSGLLWAAVPAAAGFYLARRAREVTMDELGARAYWASLGVLVVAATGVLRPTWDPNAGSRFARGGGAAPAATQTSQIVPAADEGLVTTEGGAESVIADQGAADDQPVVGGTTPAESGAMAYGNRQWARSRVAAARRAMQGVEAGAAFIGPTAEAAGFGEDDN